MSTTATYPGYRWSVTATRGWRKAGDAWAWVRYAPAAYGAPTARTSGFAPTREAAIAAATDAPS